MKVKELIAELSRLDQELAVVVHGKDSHFPCEDSAYSVVARDCEHYPSGCTELAYDLVVVIG